MHEVAAVCWDDQHRMNQLFADMIPNKVLVFIDDILVHGSTWGEHLDNLQMVLQRLRSAGLQVKVSKCSWAQKETKYLGHVIMEGKKMPDKDKIKAVEEMATPTNVAEMRSFLGMAGFY